MWLRTSKWKGDSERQMEKRHDGSEFRTKDKWRLWTPNWRCNSKCQNEKATLNVKRKRDMMTPNVELKWRLWMPKWKCDFERKRDMVALNVELKTNDLFERQTKNAVLNAKMKMRLWMSDEKETWWLRMLNWGQMTALNAKTENAALNAKIKMWLWKSNRKYTWWLWMSN